MRELAQTNVQLIRQIVESEWADDDLLRLRAAYELAMWAYSGQYRANGKTQIAHHVGAASALVAVGERPALVTAALVHAIYVLGEFGSGHRGPHPEKRERVRDALGEEIDGLLAAYSEFEWSKASVARMTAEAGRAMPLQRDLVAMRVANEVDEHTDFAMRLCAPHHAYDLAGEGLVDAASALADAYGLDALGALLRDAHARGSAETLPDVLVTSEDTTVFVAPASYCRRLHIALQDSRVGHQIAESVPGARHAAVWVRRRIA